MSSNDSSAGRVEPNNAATRLQTFRENCQMVGKETKVRLTAWSSKWLEGMVDPNQLLDKFEHNLALPGKFKVDIGFEELVKASYEGFRKFEVIFTWMSDQDELELENADIFKEKQTAFTQTGSGARILAGLLAGLSQCLNIQVEFTDSRTLADAFQSQVPKDRVTRYAWEYSISREFIRYCGECSEMFEKAASKKSRECDLVTSTSKG